MEERFEVLGGRAAFVIDGEQREAGVGVVVIVALAVDTWPGIQPQALYGCGSRCGPPCAGRAPLSGSSPGRIRWP